MPDVSGSDITQKASNLASKGKDWVSDKTSDLTKNIKGDNTMDKATNLAK